MGGTKRGSCCGSEKRGVAHFQIITQRMQVGEPPDGSLNVGR